MLKVRQLFTQFEVCVAIARHNVCLLAMAQYSPEQWHKL